MSTARFCMLMAAAACLLSGCVTVGRQFSDEFASRIVIGQTTRAEVENALGEPFRTGLDSGDETATYLYYHMGLFSETVTEDLTVTYSRDNKVKAYNYNSN